MKAKLIFNLPEEREEYEMTMNALKYFSVLFEFDNHLRSKLKHEDLTDEVYDVYEKVRGELWEIMNNEGVTL